MKPTPRRLLAATLAATAATLATPDARGVTVARVTRHGYILTDDPGQPEWNDTIPIANSRDMYTFISEATNALENVDGFHEGQYLATMQIPSGMGNAVAFYLPIRNDVRGIGQQSPIDSHVEVFDLNRTIGTGFSLNGFLWLNTVRFYTDPRTVNYGRYLLCTQEFGHRFGATSRSRRRSFAATASISRARSSATARTRGISRAERAATRCIPPRMRPTSSASGTSGDGIAKRCVTRPRNIAPTPSNAARSCTR